VRWVGRAASVSGRPHSRGTEAHWRSTAHAGTTHSSHLTAHRDATHLRLREPQLRRVAVSHAHKLRLRGKQEAGESP